MAQLNLGAIKDIGGIGGFTFTSGGNTANGTLNVQDIEISGTLAGSSAYIVPYPSMGQHSLGVHYHLLQVSDLCRSGLVTEHGINHLTLKPLWLQ